jgi:hypothetical protein
MAIVSAQIFIDGQETDYENITSLPLQFNKQVDDVLNVVGAIGLEINQIASSLVFPATKRNEAIFNQINSWQTLNNSILGLVGVSIQVDGQVAYTGSGYISLITASGRSPKKYSLTILSDVNDIFPLLEDTLLTDLPLLNQPTNYAAIVQSWTLPNAICVMPPIFYGSIGPDRRYPNGYDGGRDIDSPFSNFYVQDLRPHVKIWWIIKRLFENYLGFTISSEIYESDYFRQWCYMFGVGNDWKRTDNISNMRLSVYGGGTTLTRIAGTPEFMDILMPAIPFDGNLPFSQWGWNTTFYPSLSDGWHYFEFLVTSPQTDFSIRITIIITDPTNLTTIEEEYGTFNVNEVYTTDPIYFNRQNGITQLKLQVELPTVGDSFYYIYAGLKSYMMDIGSMGSPISIASCLHGNKVSDFLLGVLHPISGVLSVDMVTRTVYMENRFQGPQLTPQSGYPVGNAWYKFPVEDSNNLFLSELGANQDAITERHSYDFGDDLTLGYKSSSDPLLKAYEDANTSGLKFGDAKFSFERTTKPGKVVRNPYFEEMVNYGEAYPAASNSSLIIGSILAEEPSDNGQEIYKLPERTFTSDPKLAYYHGILSVPNATSIFWWKFALSLGAPYLVSVPLMYTRFPNITLASPGDPAILPNGFPRPNLCYCDLTYSGVVNYGFLRRFYLEYLAIMNEGRKVEVETLVNYDEFKAENFRNIRRVSKFRESMQVLIFEYSNFEPLKSRKLSATGLVVKMPTQKDLDAISQNSTNFTYIRTLRNTLPF